MFLFFTACFQGGYEKRAAARNEFINALELRRRQLNFLLDWYLGEFFQVGRSIGEIIIIFSLRVGKSKNKNIYHGGKHTCA